MNNSMFKKVVVSVFLGFMIYFLAINFNDNSEPASYFNTNQRISKEAAMEIAQKEVDYRVNFSENSKWTFKSKVVDAFPIFMDGIENVCYYECKIMTDGLDAGYILVNVNQTDLLISESSQEGITLTERYRAKLDRDDFMVLRYDWFRSTAVEKPSGVVNSHGNVLASIGLEETATPENAIDNYRDAVLAEGCIPVYSKKEIEDYYQDLQSSGYTLNWGHNAWAGGDYRDITAELEHKCWCNRNNECFYTPRWRQFEKSNGHAIGCGNTAWAIVYGYWAKCKNYNRLFDGDVSDGEKIKQCMRDCARYTETSDVTWKGKKMARTSPSKMDQGIRYAKNKGYSRSTVQVKLGSEYNKFDDVKRYLDADKPCIVLVTYTTQIFPDHYVVIEKGSKRQKKVLGRWRDRDVFYTVNLGNQGPSKEIWVREYGANRHEHYAAYNYYLIDVR
jgi:hypothetical protein